MSVVTKKFIAVKWLLVIEKGFYNCFCFVFVRKIPCCVGGIFLEEVCFCLSLVQGKYPFISFSLVLNSFIFFLHFILFSLAESKYV